MANNRIQIKRSTTTAITNTTPSVNAGELVFSSNGYILAIGDPANSANVISIGGARYPGTLTANQALIANATSGIDKVIVANLAANSVWANGSAGTDGQVLTSNGTVVFWKNPSAAVAGSDTQVQFNDGGSLAGDAGFTFNKTTDALTVNGSFVTPGTGTGTGGTIQNTTVMFVGNNTINTVITSAGLAVNGTATIANSSGVYATTVNAASHTVGTSFTANSTLVNAAAINITGQVNTATLYATTSANIASAVQANSTGLWTTGTVNAATVQVGTSVVANSTRLVIGTAVGLQVNGSIGSAGQILYSNGTTGYWAAAPVGTITGVTAGSGLTGGGASGSVTLDVGAGNGISVSADAVAAVANSGLVANTTGIHIVTSGDSTLIANTSGLFVNDATISIATSQLTGDVALGTQTSGNYVATVSAANGIGGAVAGAEGATPSLYVVANNGIVANSTGVWAAAANGISVTASGINVLAGNTGVISNTSGVFVNAATFTIATSQLSGDVALGTNTSGNYVATVAAGNGMVVAGSGSETAAVTVSVLANTGVVANSTGIFIGQPVSTTSNVTFANVVTTLFTSSGNTILGTSTADTLNTRGSFSNNLMPSANVTYDIGSNAMRWREIHASNVHSVVGYFDNNLNVGGDLIVTGNLVTQNVQSVVISDPMIYLAGNNYVSDLVDIGLAANYYDGATQRHTGLFRDATDGIWKLFANSTQELSGNNVVNTTATGYVTASLVAYLQSGGLTTNATSVYVTANSSVNVNISANILSISALANNNLVYANSTGHLVGLALGTSGYVVQSNGTAIVYDTLDGGTF